MQRGCDLFMARPHEKSPEKSSMSLEKPIYSTFSRVASVQLGLNFDDFCVIGPLYSFVIPWNEIV